ncbi:unnamed protein product [Nippostrongylus brasiliensis]|uniref:G protein-coupled receptor n=1 Tax=Nippostrongylus brasiliensis TaxID=27835 RepID=A0A158R2E3_NIPBR|nr:unnamed protein product [Nippostrongylus brasiliensis]
MWEPTLIAQTANTVIATLASLVLNGYVTYRILTNHNNLTNYQNLLVGQAALYIFGSVICLVANERMNLQMEYMVGYPFVTLNYAAEVSIKCLLDDTQIAQECLLMIFNLAVHLVFFAAFTIGGPIFTLLAVWFEFDGETFTTVVAVYYMVFYMIFAWYPVMICMIIKWSISGFLATKGPPAKVAVEPAIHKTGRTAKDAPDALGARILSIDID